MRSIFFSEISDEENFLEKLEVTDTDPRIWL